jgi:hypothetical protein
MTEVTPATADVEYYQPALNAVWDAFGQDRLIYARATGPRSSASAILPLPTK